MDAQTPATDGPGAPQGAAPVVLDVAVLEELASTAVGTAPLGLVLQRLAVIGERAIPGATAVSITVLRGRTAISAGFTGAVAAALDERQYQSGSGPCLHAAATASEVVVADTAHEVVYPELAEMAARHHIGSVVALGLTVAHHAGAALNVYRSGTGSDEAAMALTLRAARVFAAYASVAVSNAAALHAERVTSAQLSAAMASRAGIEQAKGVLVAQRSISVECAFELLTATSQRTNVKLREVAAQVVSTAAEGTAHRL